MFASWQGNESTVKALLEHKALVNDQDKVSHTDEVEIVFDMY